MIVEVWPDTDAGAVMCPVSVKPTSEPVHVALPDAVLAAVYVVLPIVHDVVGTDCHKVPDVEAN